jgi:hypothetical protein
VLARDLGRTVAELGATMDPAEYLAHLEDYRREPWGTRAIVVMLAQVCAVICNVNRGKDGKPYTAEDFLPGERDAPATPATSTFSDLLDALKGP